MERAIQADGVPLKLVMYLVGTLPTTPGTLPVCVPVVNRNWVMGALASVSFCVLEKFADRASFERARRSEWLASCLHRAEMEVNQLRGQQVSLTQEYCEELQQKLGITVNLSKALYRASAGPLLGPQGVREERTLIVLREARKTAWTWACEGRRIFLRKRELSIRRRRGDEVTDALQEEISRMQDGFHEPSLYPVPPRWNFGVGENPFTFWSTAPPTAPISSGLEDMGDFADIGNEMDDGSPPLQEDGEHSGDNAATLRFPQAVSIMPPAWRVWFHRSSSSGSNLAAPPIIRTISAKARPAVQRRRHDSSGE